MRYAAEPGNILPKLFIGYPCTLNEYNGLIAIKVI